jgi:hypothetical protein
VEEGWKRQKAHFFVCAFAPGLKEELLADGFSLEFDSPTNGLEPSR